MRGQCFIHFNGVKGSHLGISIASLIMNGVLVHLCDQFSVQVSSSLWGIQLPRREEDGGPGIPDLEISGGGGGGGIFSETPGRSVNYPLSNG
ncbi:hypothetical protein GDO78_020652 [Eleutherodactylus coqui]|uniref:Uncharacterized protein n=1 Tax=Eleutherodactylus coqui TaxID=57060 RepID=A0A8J6EBP8_ELECQ|nr:hypothetical protein GDO78_020652 [Eleutherodactylus coqui]